LLPGRAVGQGTLEEQTTDFTIPLVIGDVGPPDALASLQGVSILARNIENSLARNRDEKAFRRRFSSEVPAGRGTGGRVGSSNCSMTSWPTCLRAVTMSLDLLAESSSGMEGSVGANLEAVWADGRKATRMPLGASRFGTPISSGSKPPSRGQ
jgi:hypothetical protein